MIGAQLFGEATPHDPQAYLRGRGEPRYTIGLPARPGLVGATGMRRQGSEPEDAPPEGTQSSSEIRSGGQVTFQKRMSDGVRGGGPREIFPPFASK